MSSLGDSFLLTFSRFSLISGSYISFMRTVDTKEVSKDMSQIKDLYEPVKRSGIWLAVTQISALAGTLLTITSVPKDDREEDAGHGQETIVYR